MGWSDNVLIIGTNDLPKAKPRPKTQDPKTQEPEAMSPVVPPTPPSQNLHGLTPDTAQNARSKALLPVNQTPHAAHDAVSRALLPDKQTPDTAHDAVSRALLPDPTPSSQNLPYGNEPGRPGIPHYADTPADPEFHMDEGEAMTEIRKALTEKSSGCTFFEELGRHIDVFVDAVSTHLSEYWMLYASIIAILIIMLILRCWMRSRTERTKEKTITKKEKQMPESTDQELRV